MEEYLTIQALGKRLTLEPKTIKNKMANGTFRKGVHFFSPKGIGPRFKWGAIVVWLEGKEEKTTQEGNGSIPMARGYFLGEPDKDSLNP